MSINIVSTTDSDETVLSAIAGEAVNKSESKEAKQQSDANDSKDEKAEIKKDSESLDDEEVNKQDLDSDEEEQEDEESDSATEDDQEDDDKEKDEDESKDEKPKKKSGFKRRVERFQRRLSEKDLEIEDLRKEVLRAKDNKDPDLAQDKRNDDNNKTQATDSKPDPDKYDSFIDYQEALTDWKLDQREAKREAQDAKNRLAESDQKRGKAFQDKFNEFKESNDDFVEVLEDVSDIIITPILQESIVDSDYGPQIMYELAQDREALTKLNKLSRTNPNRAAREFGKLESKILSKLDSHKPNSKSAKGKVKTTKAPKPISTISGNSEKVSRKTIYDAENLSQAEFERMMNKRASRKY
jgi:hypothetical protein